MDDKKFDIDYVESKIQVILNKTFGSGPKTKIYKTYDRFNFACPYCGDSVKNKYKKRGNLYINSLVYHCFNDGCSGHSDLITFLKDFDEGVSNLDTLNNILDYIQDNKVTKTDIEYDNNIFKKFNEYGIPLNDVIKYFKLVDVNDSIIIKKYLKNRLLHNRMHLFYANKDDNKLFILNMYNVDTVIGISVRNFESHLPKYQIYTLERLNLMIFGNILNEDLSLIAKLNTLSSYYNIINVDFSKKVTLLEGPIDSMFIKNSTSIAGVDKSLEFFNDVDNVRYLLDNDKPGKTNMIKLIKNKKEVFLWSKLINDYKIKDDIKDVNDLIIYSWKNKLDIFKNLDKYFSNNQLDLLYV